MQNFFISPLTTLSSFSDSMFIQMLSFGILFLMAFVNTAFISMPDRVIMLSSCKDPLFLHNKVSYSLQHNYKMFLTVNKEEKYNQIFNHFNQGYNIVIWLECEVFITDFSKSIVSLLESNSGGLYDVLLSLDETFLVFNSSPQLLNFLYSFLIDEVKKSLFDAPLNVATLKTSYVGPIEFVLNFLKTLPEKELPSIDERVESHFTTSFKDCDFYFSFEQCEYWVLQLTNSSIVYPHFGSIGIALEIVYPTNNAIISSVSSRIWIGFKAWDWNSAFAESYGLELCFITDTDSAPLCNPWHSKLFTNMINVALLERGSHSFSLWFSRNDVNENKNGSPSSISGIEMQNVNFHFAPFSILQTNATEAFNITNCQGGRENWGGIFVYPPQHHGFLDFSSSSFVFNRVANAAYFELIQALMKLPDYNPNPETACLLVPNFDTLCLHDSNACMFGKQTSMYLSMLPFWNHGRNHVIFYVADDQSPPFDIGLSLLASSSVSYGALRPLDFVFPLAWYICSNDQYSMYDHLVRFDLSEMLNHSQDNRSILLSFKGARYNLTGRQSVFDRNQLKHLHNNIDVIISLYCTSINKVCCIHCIDEEVIFSNDEKCEEDKIISLKWNYNELLLTSMFCLVVPGGGYHSYRFFEVLQAGCIPVIIGDVVLPFFNYIEIKWDEAILRFDESSVNSLLIDYLRNIPLEKRISMAAKGRRIFDQHFSSIDSMVETFASNAAHSLSKSLLFNGERNAVSTSKSVTISSPTNKSVLRDGEIQVFVDFDVKDQVTPVCLSIKYKMENDSTFSPPLETCLLSANSFTINYIKSPSILDIVVFLADHLGNHLPFEGSSSRIYLFLLPLDPIYDDLNSDFVKNTIYNLSKD